MFSVILCIIWLVVFQARSFILIIFHVAFPSARKGAFANPECIILFWVELSGQRNLWKVIYEMNAEILLDEI